MVSRKSAFALTVMLLGSSAAQASAPAATSSYSFSALAAQIPSAQAVSSFFKEHGKQMAYVVTLLVAYDVVKWSAKKALHGADRALHHVSPTCHGHIHNGVRWAKNKVGLGSNGAVPANCSSTAGSAGASAAAAPKALTVEDRFSRLENQNQVAARTFRAFANAQHVDLDEAMAKLAVKEAAEEEARRKAVNAASASAATATASSLKDVSASREQGL